MNWRKTITSAKTVEGHVIAKLFAYSVPFAWLDWVKCVASRCSTIEKLVADVAFGQSITSSRFTPIRQTRLDDIEFSRLDVLSLRGAYSSDAEGGHSERRLYKLEIEYE